MGGIAFRAAGTFRPAGRNRGWSEPSTPEEEMKKSLCIAAVIALAACAGPQAATESGREASPARSSAYYCARDRLNPQGDHLECNWQPTADDACRFMKSSVLQRASLASDPQPAGRCSTGEWLVKAAPR
jgi:hypothetical protein